jgi:hypothetical protein
VLLLFVVDAAFRVALLVELLEDDDVEAVVSGCNSEECGCCCACACALIFVSLDDVLGDDDDAMT